MNRISMLALLAIALLAGCKAQKSPLADDVFYPSEPRTLAAKDSSRGQFIEENTHAVTPVDEQIKTGFFGTISVGKKKYRQKAVFAYQDEKAYHRFLEKGKGYYDLKRVYNAPLNIYSGEFKAQVRDMNRPSGSLNNTKSIPVLVIAFEHPKTHKLMNVDTKKGAKELEVILSKDPEAKKELALAKKGIKKALPYSYGGSALLLAGTGLCFAVSFPVGLGVAAVGTLVATYGAKKAAKSAGKVDKAIFAYNHIPYPAAKDAENRHEKKIKMIQSY